MTSRVGQAHAISIGWMGERHLRSDVRWQPDGVHARRPSWIRGLWLDRRRLPGHASPTSCSTNARRAFTQAGSFEAVIGPPGIARRPRVTASRSCRWPSSGIAQLGYDGVHLFAPHHLRRPARLRRLVDALSLTDLSVILYLVYNHLGPEGNYLRVRPFFTIATRRRGARPSLAARTLPACAAIRENARA